MAPFVLRIKEWGASMDGIKAERPTPLREDIFERRTMWPLLLTIRSLPEYKQSMWSL